MSVSEPGKIITPWAESGLKNTIPPASNPATGRAGFDQGFSAINMTAKEAGGIPPFGQDFNGIFYEVTNILRYMQTGGQPTFDAALATAIGGYPKGAMVLGSDGLTLWQSQVDSNTSNPDVDSTNWLSMHIKVIDSDLVISVPTDQPSISAALEYISDKRFPKATVTISVEGTLSTSSPVVVSHVDAERLKIIGPSVVTTSASSASVTPGTPNTTVDLTVANATGMEIGDWILVDVSSGTGPCRAVSGCWQITGKTGNVISYTCRTWAKAPASITVTGGTVRCLKAAIYFNDVDGICTRSRLGLLDRLAIIGNSDSYWDKNNVAGTEKGTHGVYAGGLSVGVNTWNDPAQGAASIALGPDVGINGFDQQGVVCDQSSSVFAYFVHACNNKRRGFYSAGGKIRNKLAVANGNYLDGCIADYGASIESSGLTACGNGGAGAFAFNGGSLSAPGSFLHSNAINAQARKGGDLEVSSSQYRDALTRDLYSEQGGVTADNGAFESANESLRATFGSRVSASNASFNPSAATHINAQQSVVVHSGSNALSNKITSVDSDVRNNNTYSTYFHGGDVDVGGYVRLNGELRVRNSSVLTEYGKIVPTSSGDVVFGTAALNVMTLKRNGEAIIPATGDGVTSLGRETDRWNTVYSVNGVQTTSDARLKSAVRELSQPELAAAAQLAEGIGFWEWNDQQRDREHCGLTVQRAIEVMESHGLSPFDYSFICYDEWEDEWGGEWEQYVNDAGETDYRLTGNTVLVRAAGSLYQFKDNELNRFLIAGCMHEMKSIKERLAAAGI